MKSGFTKTVWLLGFVSLFADISSELLYPVLPVYLKAAGYTMFALGVLEGVAGVIAGISKGYFGHQSDVLNKRHVFVQWGYGLSALGKLMMLGSPGLLRIFLARMTDRLGKGVRTAPRDAVLASESGGGNRAAVFGFHRAMDTLGAVTGPVLALCWLAYHPGDYESLFTMAFVPACIALVITFSLKEKRKEAATLKKYVGFFSYFKYWKSGPPSFRKLMFPLLILALVNSPDVFLLMAVKEAGCSDTMMIGVYIVFNFLYALLAVPAGYIADTIGKEKVLMAGIFMFIMAYTGMANARGMEIFAGLFIVYAASVSCLESVIKACIADMTPPEDRGRAIGFYAGTNSIGLLIAGAWTGLLWPLGGPKLVFSITAAVAAISLLILFFNRNVSVKKTADTIS